MEIGENTKWGMRSLNTTMCSDPCGDIASLGAIASKLREIYTLCFLMGVIDISEVQSTDYTLLPESPPTGIVSIRFRG